MNDIKKKRIKKVIIGLIIILIVFLSSSLYYITIDDGTYKEDKGSVSYKAAKYTSGVSVTEKGLSTKQSVEDLWKQMKEDGAPINNYLESEEELQKLTNAEIVTQYPKIGKGELDGIIEFNRIKSDGTTKKLSFIEKSRFDQLQEECESNGKTDILNYFTLDDNSNVIIAILNKTIETITTTDENIDINDYTSTDLDKIDNSTFSKTIYTVSQTKINYKSAVEKYTMPFQYLWSLLVITEDKDFVMGLADLVNKSQIIIGIYDNNTTVTNSEKYTYTNQKRTDTYVELNVKKDLGVTGYDTERYWLSSESPNAIEKYNSKYEADYEKSPQTVEYTKVKDTTTVSTNIDKVDTWIIKSESKNERSESNQINQSDNTTELEDTTFEETADSPNSSEDNADLLKNEHAKQFEKEVSNYINNKANKKNKKSEVEIKKVECRYFTNVIDRKIETSNSTKSVKNIQTITSKEIKDKPESKEVNFVTLLNKNEKAKSAMVDLSEWLFELLETNTSTLNMEDLTKYFLYIATGDSYGVKTFDFSIYDETNFNTINNSSSTSSKQLLIEYIYSWEGCTELSEDGTEYKIQDDGAGHPTVGHGIDIENSGYKSLFEQNGYSTTIGGWVNKEFVDGLEADEISSKWDAVKSLTADLNLKDYQINALVSRAYNCGTAGALTVRRGKNEYTFNEAYKEYWNEDSDDKFDQKDENAVDYDNELYTEYMDEPIYSGGNVLQGLVNRRKSEWKLFQTGYYDRIDKWHNNNSNADIISIADEIHQDEIEWSYYVNTNDLYWNNIEMSINNPNKVTCCATYVSCVLYKAGLFSEEEMNSFNYNECTALYNFLSSNDWSEIVSYDELEAGDIVFMNYNDGGKDYDHVQIYAGNDTWYNAGDTSAIRRSSPYSQGSWAENNFFVAMRLNK